MCKSGLKGAIGHCKLAIYEDIKRLKNGVEILFLHKYLFLTGVTE